MLPFQPFNEDGEVRTYYHGFLPHWRQDGCTYFVTFRLADSVPQAVLDEWKYERTAWLSARGVSESDAELGRQAFERLSKQEQQQFERHFAGILHRYLDSGFGACVLRKRECSEMVADALEFYHASWLPRAAAVGQEEAQTCGGPPQPRPRKQDESRVVTGDYVVMPNHVHVLLTPLPRFELEDILQAIKSYTAHQINKKINSTGKLWMKESYDHIVRDAEELVRIQHYIRANPAKASLPSQDFVLAQAEYELKDCT